MFKWVNKLLVLKALAQTTLLAGLSCFVATSMYMPTGYAQSQVQAAPQMATQVQIKESRTNPVIESAPSWKSLTSAQQIALKPIQADWSNLDANRKKKWLAVAQRYQTMTAADQARMHERMSQWTKLSPAQRSAARDNYSAVLSSPNTAGSQGNDAASKANLNEQWTKYQALSPEKKASLNELANKADVTKSKPLSAP